MGVHLTEMVLWSNRKKLFGSLCHKICQEQLYKNTINTVCTYLAISLDEGLVKEHVLVIPD